MNTMVDVNNLILTDIGRSYIWNKVDNNQKVVFSKFRLSDLHIFTPAESMTTLPGAITYIGSEAEMFYVFTGPHECILRCCVESDKGDFLIGSAGIYNENDDLVFITRFTYQHHKMASTLSQVGGRWTYQIRLTMENIRDVFDLSNLTEKPAVFDALSLATAPSYPFDSYYSEITLKDCLFPTGRKAYPVLSGNVNRRWFSSQFQTKYSEIASDGDYIIDGGVVSDQHNYS